MLLATIEFVSIPDVAVAKVMPALVPNTLPLNRISLVCVVVVGCLIIAVLPMYELATSKTNISAKSNEYSAASMVLSEIVQPSLYKFVPKADDSLKLYVPAAPDELKIMHLSNITSIHLPSASTPLGVYV